MSEAGTSSFEDLELYRTAQEFRSIACRVARALPMRKFDVKQALVNTATALLSEIAQSTSADVRAEALRAAQQSGARSQELLTRLQLTRQGGKADVTAGLEILERIDALLRVQSG